MAMLKSILALCGLSSAVALTTGDCAFVGIYGDQDDFAVVLMEDADGEQLFLTEDLPSANSFKVKQFVEAKKTVQHAKRGTVLKKADFESDVLFGVAPNGLTLFTGSSELPVPLCSISLESNRGSVARKLSEEVSVVMLGMAENAQYAGSTSGSKADLLEDISDPNSWTKGGALRKLSGFSIAMANSTSSTTKSTQSEAPPSRTVVSACTELGGAVDQLVDSEDAVAAFTTAIAKLAGNLPESYVQNVIFSVGASCGARRLSSDRRLQTSGTVTYDLVFPPEAGGGQGNSQQEAASAITALENLDTATVSSAIAAEVANYESLSGVVVTVTNVGTFTTTETGGTTSSTTSTTPGGGDSTSLTGGTGSGACEATVAGAGLLLSLTYLI